MAQGAQRALKGVNAGWSKKHIEPRKGRHTIRLPIDSRHFDPRSSAQIHGKSFFQIGGDQCKSVVLRFVVFQFPIFGDVGDFPFASLVVKFFAGLVLANY